ncbi:hypothetical protein HWV62_35 [Athelia sp. TMB]|nr:hypothetical protein HWV62_35 [Athelia sp. TMB]
MSSLDLNFGWSDYASGAPPPPPPATTEDVFGPHDAANDVQSVIAASPIRLSYLRSDCRGSNLWGSLMRVLCSPQLQPPRDAPWLKMELVDRRTASPTAPHDPVIGSGPTAESILCLTQDKIATSIKAFQRSGYQLHSALEEVELDPVTASITVVPLDQSLPRLTYHPCPYAEDALLRGILTDPSVVFLDGDILLVFREADLPPKRYTLDSSIYSALEEAISTHEDAAQLLSAMGTSSSAEPITITHIADDASSPSPGHSGLFAGQQATSSLDTREKRRSIKTPEERIQCPEPGCNQILGRGSEANRHYWSRHSNKKLLCPLCFSIFSGKRPDAVRTHLKVVHKSDQQGVEPLQGLLSDDGSRLAFTDREDREWEVATRLGLEGKKVMRTGSPKLTRGHDADSSHK